jgi:hypothetical protein
MTTMIFDTLAYANKLKAAGVPDKQAEVQAEAISELIDEKLATKQDLEILAYKLTIRLGSMMVAGFSILGVLIKIGH